jgi:hypothetical protein
MRSRVVGLMLLLATSSCANLTSGALGYTQRSNSDFERMWADQSDREHDQHDSQHNKTENLKK